MDQTLFNTIQSNLKTFLGRSSNPTIEPPAVFTFNSSHIGRKLSDIAQDIKIKSLIGSGMPEDIIKKSIQKKKWGWKVGVKKITDYEKTKIFGYGDDEIGYHILFIDGLGNDFICIANTTLQMERGKKYMIDGTISEIDPIDDHHSKLHINRVKIIKDLQATDDSTI